MVWLEGILHHSDEPPAFLQVPCHGRVRLGSARATHRQARQGRGQVGGTNRRLKLAGPGGGDPEPPGEDSARVANPSQGPTLVEGVRMEGGRGRRAGGKTIG